MWQRLNLMNAFNKLKHKERYSRLEAHVQSLRLSSSDSSAPGWPELPGEISGKNAIKNNPQTKKPLKLPQCVYINTHIYVATEGIEGFFAVDPHCGDGSVEHFFALLTLARCVPTGKIAPCTFPPESSCSRPNV